MKFTPHTTWNGREINFPEAQKFSDLFARIDSRIEDHNPAGLIKISSYCALSGQDFDYSSIEVEPAKQLIDWVVEHMLYIEHDDITFSIVRHDEKNALVLAKYGQIIGSSYLAYIDTSTIPE